MAYILLEYSSDGPLPSVVDRRMQDLGLTRDGAFFTLHAADEDDLLARIDRLHDALRGTGARYTVTTSRAGGEAGDLTEMVLELGNLAPDSEDALLEDRMEQVSLELTSGGRSFDDLLEALDVDGPVLERVLGKMMEQGLVTAYREEDGLSYHLGGPMLRSLAR